MMVGRTFQRENPRLGLDFPPGILLVKQHSTSSAVAVHLGGLCAVAEAGALVRVEQARVVVQALGHLVADDVHKALEHSLGMRKDEG